MLKLIITRTQILRTSYIFWRLFIISKSFWRYSRYCFCNSSLKSRHFQWPLTKISKIFWWLKPTKVFFVYFFSFFSFMYILVIFASFVSALFIDLYLVFIVQLYLRSIYSHYIFASYIPHSVGWFVYKAAVWVGNNGVFGFSVKGTVFLSENWTAALVGMERLVIILHVLLLAWQFVRWKSGRRGTQVPGLVRVFPFLVTKLGKPNRCCATFGYSFIHLSNTLHPFFSWLLQPLIYPKVTYFWLSVPHSSFFFRLPFPWIHSCKISVLLPWTCTNI